MKKRIVTLSLLFISVVAFAQKSELKKADKALKSGKTAEAKAALDAAESLIGSADDKTKAKFYLTKGKINQILAQKGTEGAFDTAVSSFNEVVKLEESGKKTYTIEAKTLLTKVSEDLVNSAVADQNSQKFGAAAKKLYQAYQINKINQDYLYFAASSAVQAEDYDTALVYYNELDEIGYTGSVTEYYAVNKETGEEEKIANKRLRDLYIKNKTHTTPTEKLTESRRPEIVKNIALIYTQKGETQNAIKAVKKARLASPDDVSLLITEANLYISLDEKDKFQALTKEAIQKDPNNSTLYYNLGVVNHQQGEFDQAKEYYEKAVELNPKHKDSYANLASLVLEGEPAIVEELNSLGTSRADNIRYDELKAKRENLFKSAIPYLESVLGIEENNLEALKTLMNIHGTLGNTDKFRELKDKLATLEQ